ncbi:Peptidase S64, Ssy5 [Artemisia annua]|uniref:Peptidase S64, Ssy5 n=1 Tax=Artemisia annua TaxID=35608 RepID=A0A2U1KW15_ARTAN|nr:Peptidase S64, Ssy5 [Artemisia annua]
MSKSISLGTAIGFRIRQGVLTDIPAILVFVSSKVHKKWLTPIQCLPTILEGLRSVWCDMDVVEFSYFGALEREAKNICTLKLWMICMEVARVSVQVLR